MEPAGRGSEEAIDECRGRAAAGGVKIIENQYDIPLQVEQRLAKRLAQLSRTEAIGHGEQGEEGRLDTWGDTVERNRDVSCEPGEIGIAGIDRYPGNIRVPRVQPRDDRARLPVSRWCAHDG